MLILKGVCSFITSCTECIKRFTKFKSCFSVLLTFTTMHKITLLSFVLAFAAFPVNSQDRKFQNTINTFFNIIKYSKH